MHRRRLVVAGTAVVVVMLVACSSRNASPPAFTPSSEVTHLLEQAQAAVDRSSSYRISVTESNFVLPQWGGVDSGTVEVSLKGKVVVAVLARTGEPGATYTIMRGDNQTYFQRSTCQQAFRIPGGGAEVLTPFLLHVSQPFLKVQDGRVLAPSIPGGPLRIEATFEGIHGPVIELDPTIYRVLRITGTLNNAPFVWEFDNWDDHDLAGIDLAETPTDRGPGGIPC